MEDYSLLSFVPLAIEDKESVQRSVALIDKATGYVFSGLAGSSPYPPEFVYGAGLAGERDLETLLKYEELYMNTPSLERQATDDVLEHS